MSKIKQFIKKILLNIPLINTFFISFNYKINKTIIKIHNHTSHEMIMTKNNYQIYEKSNAGKVTGLDNDMNYEYAFSKKIIDEASKEKIFFDVGAAYGHYSWLASKLYDRVYCFEGDDLELFFLKRNFHKIRNIKIIENFVNNKFTLDNFCKLNNFFPDLVKIDAEGEEINIIKNSTQLLKNNTKFLIEFHRRLILEKFSDIKVIDDFFETFRRYGYNIEFNNHHRAKSLLDMGVSDKVWGKKNPENDNCAIFCYPEKKPK